MQAEKHFSDDIGMSLGLDKCAKATFKTGKFVHYTKANLGDDNVIRNLEQEILLEPWCQ